MTDQERAAQFIAELNEIQKKWSIQLKAYDMAYIQLAPCNDPGFPPTPLKISAWVRGEFCIDHDFNSPS